MVVFIWLLHAPRFLDLFPYVCSLKEAINVTTKLALEFYNEKKMQI